MTSYFRLLLLLLFYSLASGLAGQRFAEQMDQIATTSDDELRQSQYQALLEFHETRLQNAWSPGPEGYLEVAMAAQLAGAPKRVKHYLKKGMQQEPLKMLEAYAKSSVARRFEGGAFADQFKRLMVNRLSQKNWADKEVQHIYSARSELYLFHAVLARHFTGIGDTERALTHYRTAFKEGFGSFLSLLRAGYAAALEDQEDEARRFLGQAFNLEAVYGLTYLRLHKDFLPGAKHPVFLRTLQAEIDRWFPEFNPTLVRKLDEMWYEHITWYGFNPGLPDSPRVREADCFSEMYHPDYLEYRDALTRLREAQLDTIFSEYGIPTSHQIADRDVILMELLRGTSTAFLNRHWEALLKGRETAPCAILDPRTLGHYYDLACVREGKRQRYGSVMLWDADMRQREGINFWPVEAPQSLNARRKRLGMTTINDAFAFRNLTFSPEAHLSYSGLPVDFKPLVVPIKAYNVELPQFRVRIGSPCN